MGSEFDIETFDEEQLRQNREKAETLASNLTIEEYFSYRKRAKTDLFFLCRSVLGYDKFARLHYDISNWHSATKNEQYRELLLPRSHYKSTEFTIGDGIQIVLPDDTNAEPWPRCLGTDARVLLAHEVHESAGLFLNEITQHFLSNPMLMGLFPECIPDLKKHRVNKTELELPRKKIFKEATFSTLGTGGRAQGKHFNYIKADDLIGDKARDSKTEMVAAKLWLDNIQALLVTPKDDHIDFIGTRWAFDDIYSHLHEAYGKRLIRYIRGIEERDPVTKEKRVIFPEQFSLDSLEILKKNRKVFSAQYANDPTEGAGEFNEDWKKLYSLKTTRDLTKVIEFAPNKDFPDDIETREVFTELDRVILYDPAMTGLAGIVVTGMDRKENIFVLDAIKKDFSPYAAIKQIFELVMKWQPRIVGIEHVLFSALFDIIFTQEMARRGTHFQIVGVKTFGRAKDIRVKGLTIQFSEGRIYFHPSQVDLLEEYDNFGATDNYHMLDALAHGPQVWKKPVPMLQSGNGVEENGRVRGQDKHTGYSSMYDDDEPDYEILEHISAHTK